MPERPPASNTDHHATMSYTNPNPRAAFQWSWLFLFGGGVCLLLGAWFLPISVGSVHPAVLAELSRDSAGVGDTAATLAKKGRIGPAALLRKAGDAAGIQDFESLDVALANHAPTNSNAQLWRGANFLLDSGLVPLREPANNASPSALQVLIGEANRAALRNELTQTTSPGGRAILNTLKLQGWKHFSPAGATGGQALEATILLLALLHESGSLNPSLADEIAALAHASRKSENLATLEAIYLDALSLAQRFDGATLQELLAHIPDLSSLAQFTHFSNRKELDFPILYATVLMTGNARGTADYVVRFGSDGVSDLRTAMPLGSKALHTLLDREQRIATMGTAADLGETAKLALRYPVALQLVKFALFFVGAILTVAGWDGIRPKPELSIPGPAARLQPLRNGLIGILFALILAAVSEPFLLKADSQTDYLAEKRVIPVEKPEETPSNTTDNNKEEGMFENLDLSTIYTVLAFLLVQIIVYLICIQRIHQIDRMDESAVLKLRLMENEDNLFDAGLYVGIAGTALALVLQLLDVIQADLVAAYSSNLFGITCVAFVKIRNVRPYKRRLIMTIAGEEGDSGSSLRRARPSGSASQGELLT